MIRSFTLLAGAAFGLSFLAAQAPTPGDGIDVTRKIATFSIAAVDPETGVCGGAVASKYPAVGKAVVYCRAGVGAFCTQHYNVNAWGPKAQDLMGDGKLPEEVFTELLKGDKA